MQVGEGRDSGVKSVRKSDIKSGGKVVDYLDEDTYSVDVHHSITQNEIRSTPMSSSEKPSKIPRT